MEHVIDLIGSGASQVPFRAVYGTRTNNRGYVASYPTIAFYDRRYDFDTHGQFISEYTPETFLDHGPYALILDGGVDEWTLDRGMVDFLYTWLVTILTRR